jgi:hypothetical protein
MPRVITPIDRDTVVVLFVAAGLIMAWTGFVLGWLLLVG